MSSIVRWTTRARERRGGRAAAPAAAGQAAVLVWRRAHPDTVVGAVAVAVPVAAAAGIGIGIGLTSVPVVVACYALATVRSPVRASPLLHASGVLAAVGHAVAGSRTNVRPVEAVTRGLLQAVVLVAAPLAVAALVVARRESRSARCPTGPSGSGKSTLLGCVAGLAGLRRER